MIEFRKLFKLKENKCENDHFEEMSKTEKKVFLSNDLIERLIRVEQRVCMQFGQKIPYNKTEYYKNLTEREKKGFQKYLRNKNKKGIFVFSFLVLLIFASLFLNLNFTGNVVKENLEIPRGMDYLFVFFVIFLFIGIVNHLRYQKTRRKMIETNFKIIEDLFMGKYINKKGH